LIYYPDHDKRYAHIAERERWKYPDAVKIGPFAPIERTKPHREITFGETGGWDPLLLANDVPITDCCCRC
ncbi:hypothetical protein HY413_03400, partial [Candidatus Kaiserbacteria bacterium]|nr:hypothetical protein [Candidatus Kaiserbacteria bacterium]